MLQKCYTPFPLFLERVPPVSLLKLMRAHTYTQVELEGTQFKVTVDDVIFVNSLMGKARINEV